MMNNNSCINNEDWSLYSKKYQIKIKGLIKFELKSFIGRLFFSRKPPSSNKPIKLLNLGCGSRYINGWINADFFVIKFWKAPKSLWMLDLRYPLKCNSNYWDGVFIEHTIEHLYPIEAKNLLKEVFRTLKKGHWLRISVPDLEKYINYYLGKPSNEEFHKWATGAEAIRSLTQNWNHHSLYDSQLLKSILRQIGFINVRKVEFRKGTDKKLLMDSEDRKLESLYIEAQKPLHY